jgi:hypothetical protein
MNVSPWREVPEPAVHRGRVDRPTEARHRPPGRPQRQHLRAPPQPIQAEGVIENKHSTDVESPPPPRVCMRSHLQGTGNSCSTIGSSASSQLVD